MKRLTFFILQHVSMSKDETKALLELGEKIKKIRKQKGYSQDRLYLEAGFSRGTMSRVERGLVNPTYLTLKKIADTLGVKLSKLLP